MAVIDRIAERAWRFSKAKGVDYTRKTIVMDLVACNANGTPLDLARLENAPDFDFIHDIFGIRRHINRQTGKIEDCFLPRCAARMESVNRMEA